MKIKLSHPERQVEVKGPKRGRELLKELNLMPEAHLLIRGNDLVTEDEMLKDDDTIEIRPVISGGSRPRGCSKSPPARPQGRTVRRIRSTKSVRAAEPVRRPGD